MKEINNIMTDLFKLQLQLLLILVWATSTIIPMICIPGYYGKIIGIIGFFLVQYPLFWISNKIEEKL